MTTSTPTTPTMRLQRRGHAEYVLWHRTEEIGRMRGHVLRLHGFDTDADARAAGRAACEALAQWYRERGRLGHPATMTTWDEAEDIPPAQRLTLDGVVLGRVVTATDRAAREVASGEPAGAEDRDMADPDHLEAPHGFELVLPHTLLHALATHLIRRLDSAAAPWRGPRGAGSSASAYADGPTTRAEPDAA